MSELSINEIVTAFANTDSYQRAAVDAALARRDEIVPELVRILEATLANPAAYEDSPAPYYALFLLGHLRATEGHQVIVDLFSLPNDWPDHLFGDMITEVLFHLLLRTAGGSLERIQALIQNQTADDFVRGAAAEALTYAVVEGELEREAAVAFLGGLLTGAESADPNSAFWSLIIMALRYLHPTAVMPAIRHAYAADLIESHMIDLPDLEQIVATESVEQSLASARRQMQDHWSDDIHDLLGDWVNIGSPEHDYAHMAAIERRSPKVDKAKRSKQKNKRKMAKASRKKNRRK